MLIDYRNITQKKWWKHLESIILFTVGQQEAHIGMFHKALNNVHGILHHNFRSPVKRHHWFYVHLRATTRVINGNY